MWNAGPGPWWLVAYKKGFNGTTVHYALFRTAPPPTWKLNYMMIPGTLEQMRKDYDV